MFLTGLVLLPPLKNGPKNTRGPDRVENHRKIVPGIELTVRYQHTIERAGSYPNSNRRPIISDVSLVRYANRLAASAGRYIGHHH